MTKPVLLFRADASSQMGTGHLVRSASLAKILSAEFTCKLLTTCTIPELLEMAGKKFAEVHVIDGNGNEAVHFEQHSDRYKLAVIDGYHFDKAYQQMLEAKGFRIAVIDDLITEPVSADLVINHCGGLSPLHYQASSRTVFGLGTAYLLLNPAFLIAADERRINVNDRNCFVCLGGADPANETLQVVKELTSTDKFDVLQVLIGAAYLHKETLQAYCSGHKNIVIHQAISPDAVKQVMAQCSYAVCAPSTIAYEYLSVGGVMWLKQIADNQKNILRFLTEEGIAYDFQKDAIDPRQDFTPLLERQRSYFDGKADLRLKKLFSSWFLASQTTIRKAGEDDLLTCYNWVNDPEVRSQSYSSEPIPLENHTTWFRKKIKAPDCYYYLLLHGESPVAQIRFDMADDQATISYLTDQQIRNKGLGPWILSKGIEKLLLETRPTHIIGHVKKTNIASLRSFEKLAFEKAESKTYPDSITYTMTVHGNHN